MDHSSNDMGEDKNTCDITDKDPNVLLAELLRSHLATKRSFSDIQKPDSFSVPSVKLTPAKRSNNKTSKIMAVPVKKADQTRKVYKCYLCPFTSFYPSNLRTHLRRHTQ